MLDQTPRTIKPYAISPITSKKSDRSAMPNTRPPTSHAMRLVTIVACFLRCRARQIE